MLCSFGVNVLVFCAEGAGTLSVAFMGLCREFNTCCSSIWGWGTCHNRKIYNIELLIFTRLYLVSDGQSVVFYPSHVRFPENACISLLVLILWTYGCQNTDSWILCVAVLLGITPFSWLVHVAVVVSYPACDLVFGFGVSQTLLCDFSATSCVLDKKRMHWPQWGTL